MRKVRKLLASIAAMMLLVLLAVPAAAEEAWDGAVIDSVEDLQAFAGAVNGGDTFQGKTVTLAANIDLAGMEWTPIGYKGATFRGTFEGGGYTISNLYVSRGLENTAANNGVGLFGRTDSPAVIQNLTIENADVSGSLYVGAVVGLGYTGTKIENVTVKGNIAIDAWWYAGVIGGNGYLSLINNCHVIGNDGSYIKGNDGSYIGGIWGFRGEGGMKITGCSVSNLGISGDDRVGGISGMAHYGNEISGCTVNAVTIQAMDGEATTVGLIAGACQGETGSPVTFSGNTVTDSDAFAGEDPVSELYGTNISGTAAVTNYAAQVGTTGYTSVQAAVNAAGEGDTVTLLADAAEALDVDTQCAVTLDLNGYTLSSSTDTLFVTGEGTELTILDSAGSTGKITSRGNYCGPVYLDSGKVVMESGTLESTDPTLSYAVYINAGAELEVNGGKLTASAQGESYGVILMNGSLTVNGGEITAQYGISGNGTYDDSVLTVTGGTITGQEFGIYHPQAGTTSIIGGEITGSTGVYIRGGKNVTIGADAVISGTGAKAEPYYNANQDDAVPTGDALVIQNVGGEYGTPVVSVIGGTFVSANAAAAASYSVEGSTQTVTGFITAGKFNSDVTAHCADGTGVDTSAQGWWAVHTHDSDLKVPGTAAGCTTEGATDSLACSVCGEAMTQSTVIPAKGHAMEKTAAKAADCMAEGNIAYYTCTTCEKLFSDAEGKTELTAAQTVAERTAHKLTQVEAEAADCTAEGNIAYYTCSTCKKLFSDAEGKTELTAAQTVTGKTPHTLTRVEAKAATAEAEGNIEYYVCQVCGKLYSDAAMAKELTLVETVLPKLGTNGSPDTGDVGIWNGAVALLFSGTGMAALLPKKRQRI